MKHSRAEELSLELLIVQRRLSIAQRALSDTKRSHADDMRVARLLCMSLFWFGAIAGALAVYLWPAKPFVGG